MKRLSPLFTTLCVALLLWRSVPAACQSIKADDDSDGGADGPPQETVDAYLDSMRGMNKRELKEEMLSAIMEDDAAKAEAVLLSGLGRETKIQHSRWTTDYSLTVGQPPLFWAAAYNAVQCVELLIDYGANVEGRKDTWSPLQVAAMTDSLPAIRALLQSGANVSAESRENTSPLHNAVRYNGSYETVEYLVENGANTEGRHLYYAIGLRDLEMVQLLLELGANVSTTMGSDYETPLHLAAERNDTQTTEVLLRYGADPNAVDLIGWTPLHYAARRSRLENAQILVESGALVNVAAKDERLTLFGTGPLVISLCDGECEEFTGWTPLHEAAERCDSEFVKFLVSNGANVTAERGDGWTVLHAAAGSYPEDSPWEGGYYGPAYWEEPELQLPLCNHGQNGSLENVKLLLDNGVEVNAPTKFRWTALHEAAAFGDSRTTKLMIDSGADVEARGIADFSTSTNLVSRRGSRAHNPGFSLYTDAAARDIGQTPLHVAAYSGKIDNAQILLDAGASKEELDGEGKMPVEAICELRRSCTKSERKKLQELLSP